MPNYSLRIIGLADMPSALEMGSDYKITARVAIPKVEKIDLENGDYEYLHKARLINIEIADKGGKTFKGTAKGSPSQKLRWALMERMDEEGYKQVIFKILNNLDEVLDILNEKP